MNKELINKYFDSLDHVNYSKLYDKSTKIKELDYYIEVSIRYSNANSDLCLFIDKYDYTDKQLASYFNRFNTSEHCRLLRFISHFKRNYNKYFN